MPVDRSLWKQFIHKANAPIGWHCPTCTSGYLRLSKDGLLFREASWSRQAHNEDWFDGEHAELRFTAALECTNERCGEFVAVNGSGGYSREMNEDGSNWDWEEYFWPLSVSPAMHFFRVPPSVPEKVVEQLKLSFATLWSSPAAAATHVRIAVEYLLDAIAIPRARRSTSKKMQQLTLHRRIEELRSRKADVGEALLAIKWVGNAASHLGDLARDDVFDAYDILEGVLDDLFVRNREAVQKLVRKINKKKGPWRKQQSFL